MRYDRADSTFSTRLRERLIQTHMRLLATTLLLSLTVCRSTAAPASVNATTSAADVIPLTIVNGDSGEHLARISVVIDGHPESLLLDTGSASTTLPVDDYTSAFASDGATLDRGVSGVSDPCDYIRPAMIELGTQRLTGERVKRCKTGTLGIDWLAKWVFRIDLAEAQLGLLNSVPKKARTYPLMRLHSGHVVLPMQLSGLSVNGLFDTGSDATVIDLRFLQAHRSLFDLGGSDPGLDVNGHPIQSDVYTCRSVRIGRLKLSNVRLVAFEFPEDLRSKMEGAPLIIGTNIISRSVWSFDVAARKWAME